MKLADSSPISFPCCNFRREGRVRRPAWTIQNLVPRGFLLRDRFRPQPRCLLFSATLSPACITGMLLGARKQLFYLPAQPFPALTSYSLNSRQDQAARHAST